MQGPQGYPGNPGSPGEQGRPVRLVFDAIYSTVEHGLCSTVTINDLANWLSMKYNSNDGDL